MKQQPECVNIIKLVQKQILFSHKLLNLISLKRRKKQTNNTFHDECCNAQKKATNQQPKVKQEGK